MKELGFTVVVDMRGAGSTWATVKPILKVLQEHFTSSVHQAYIIKPDNFWQKQRTSLGSHKYKFEVSLKLYILYPFQKPLLPPLERGVLPEELEAVLRH